MHNPTLDHWIALKRILRYLRSTQHHGLYIRQSPSTTISAYSDAEWGSNKDDIKSTTGYAIFLGANLINWGSHK